mmetsp:Transcript_116109/g.163184  ORF Transcript_116109/g.163184 Transcript_116109/m.163184 type:complete len:103 (+) Transcript_116109:217-525(+)
MPFCLASLEGVIGAMTHQWRNLLLPSFRSFRSKLIQHARVLALRPVPALVPTQGRRAWYGNPRSVCSMKQLVLQQTQLFFDVEVAEFGIYLEFIFVHGPNDL